MTLAESRLTVFAMTAPHPSRKAREITFRFVPGGPDPMTNGLGNLSPSTVVASVGMVPPLIVNRPVYRIRLQSSINFFVARWIVRSAARCFRECGCAATLSSSDPAAAGLDPPDRFVGEL